MRSGAGCFIRRTVFGVGLLSFLFVSSYAAVDLRVLQWGNGFAAVQRPWGELWSQYRSDSSHRGVTGPGWCLAVLLPPNNGRQRQQYLEGRLFVEADRVRIRFCEGHGAGEQNLSLSPSAGMNAALGGRSLPDAIKAAQASIELVGDGATVSLTGEGAVLSIGRHRVLFDRDGWIIGVDDIKVARDSQNRISTIGSSSDRLAFTYGAAGQVASINMVDQNTGADYQYDVRGRMTGLRNAWLHVYRFRYNDRDQITLERFPNDTFTGVFYDRQSGKVVAVTRRDNCFDSFREIAGRSDQEKKVLIRRNCDGERARDLETTIRTSTDGRVQHTTRELTPDGFRAISNDTIDVVDRFIQSD